MTGQLIRQAAWMASLLWALLCGIEDVRRRSVRLLWFLIAAGPGIACMLLSRRLWNEVLVSCLPGSVLLAASLLTGQVGRGDGYFFLVLALYLPGRELLAVFLISMGMCAVASLIYIVRLRFRSGQCRKARVPYLCFVLPAMLACLACRLYAGGSI